MWTNIYLYSYLTKKNKQKNSVKYTTQKDKQDKEHNLKHYITLTEGNQV